VDCAKVSGTLPDLKLLSSLRHGVQPMGWTSEMLALEYDISRATQDTYGLLSHRRASAAQSSGKFDAEIMPLRTTVLSDSEDTGSDRLDVVVCKDDGIRHNLTPEQMAAARSAFKGSGDERSTGPNSSQVTDGAAMVLLMRRRRAEELGLEVLAKHVGTSVVGVTPRVMGVGPVEAIP
jgi:acetyl-CoA acyltransferase 1